MSVCWLVSLHWFFNCWIKFQNNLSQMTILFNHYPQIYSLIKRMKKLSSFDLVVCPSSLLSIILYFSADNIFLSRFHWTTLNGFAAERIYSVPEWTWSNILLYGEEPFNENSFSFPAKLLRKNSERCISKSIAFKFLCSSTVSLRCQKEFWSQLGNPSIRG